MNWNRAVRSEYRRLQTERQIQITNVWNENRLSVQESTITTDGRCDWRLDHGDPSRLSKGSSISVSLFDNDEDDLQVVPIYVLPRVESPPQNITWLHVPRNMPMKVLQSKTYIPYLGNEAVDSGFVDELMELNKCDDDNRPENFMVDEMFVKLVETLIECQQRNTNTATSSLPAPIIFQSIREYFRTSINADYLREKYEKLTKRVPTRPNIDEPMEDALDRTEALKSYHKLFCRKCFIYSCPYHAHETDDTFVPKPKAGDIAPVKPVDRPCSNACYMVENTGYENRCGNSSNSTTDRTLIGENVASNVDTQWSAGELTMLGILVPTFPNNSCVISEIIRSKSCKEVHRQFESSNQITPIRSKKSKVYNRGWRTQNVEKVSKPCNHEGLCSDTATCLCINCEKFCNCDADCKYRTRMTCNCKKFCTTQSCLCVKLLRECDPDLCTCVSCKNVNMQRSLDKKTHVATSNIHGWGLFVDEDCQKGDYVTEYKGELIPIEEADRRAKLYSKENSTYMFALNDEFVIDAMNYGGKFRFTNFSRFPNCESKILRVNGDHRIGIYAKKFIQSGEELTLDYLTIDPTVNQ